MPSEREKVVAIMRDLNLPRGQYALSGSGVIFMHGVPREKPLGDLDVFVATRRWFAMLSGEHPVILRDAPGRTQWDRDHAPCVKWEVVTTDPTDFKRRCDPPYLKADMHGVEVNVFFEWRTRGVGDIDVNFWLHNAEPVDNIACVPIQFLLDWKETVGRAKDADDIRLLRDYLGTAS